jgi:hypothetical protein
MAKKRSLCARRSAGVQAGNACSTARWMFSNAVSHGISE